MNERDSSGVRESAKAVANTKVSPYRVLAFSALASPSDPRRHLTQQSRAPALCLFGVTVAAAPAGAQVTTQKETLACTQRPIFGMPTSKRLLLARLIVAPFQLLFREVDLFPFYPRCRWLASPSSQGVQRSL